MLRMNEVCVPTTAEECVNLIKFGVECHIDGFAECLEDMLEERDSDYENMLFIMANHVHKSPELNLIYTAIELAQALDVCIVEHRPTLIEHVTFEQI